MPPIQDPLLLEQIKRQQQQQGKTLAQMPPPYYSGPSASDGQSSGLDTSPLPHGTRPASVDPYAGPRFRLSAESNARAAEKAPVELDIARANAETAKLTLRQKRMEQGLDPDTGKPTATAGLVGPQAIADLSPGEQDIVKGITQGRVPVSSLALSRNPKLFALVQRAFQLEPGTDLTTFQRRQAAMQKYLSNPNSPIIRVNQALQHLDRFYTNAQKLDNFHSKEGFEAPLNWVRSSIMQKDPRFVAFNTDLGALADELAAAFKGSNDTAHASKEYWLNKLGGSNSPEGFTAAVKEATSLLAGRIEANQYQFQQAAGPNGNEFDLMSPEARKAYEKFSSEDFGAPAQGLDKQLSTTKQAITFPPGAQDEHKAYLDTHKGDMTVEDYINFRKQLDAKYGIKEGDLNTDEVRKYVEDINKGGKSAKLPPIGEKDLNPLEKQRAQFANSDFGVGLGNALNASTMGAVDLAIGQEGRDAKELADKEHWKSALAGEVVGSIAPITGLSSGGERLLAKLGLTPQKAAALLGGTKRAALAGDVAANAAYGGIRGFNGADEGEGLEGALEGAGGGALGAGVGNAVTKGLTPVLKDSTLAALEKMKGVKMTTLQRLGLGQAEGTFSGVPFAHGQIRNSMKSFNKDNANRALSYIENAPEGKVTIPDHVEPGTDLNAAMNARINEAYSRVRPKIFGSADSSTPAGKDFNTAIKALKATANTPEKKAMFKDIEDAIGLFNQGTGLYNGDSYQAASQRLRSLVKDFSQQADSTGSTAARDMARTAEAARKQMQTLIARHSPEAGAELKGVERAYAHSMRIEDASNRALAGNESVYSPAQLLTSIKKLDTSLNKGASARGKAFDQQYAQAAHKILGNTPPPKISLKETSYLSLAMGLGGYASPHLAAFIAGVGAGAYGPFVKKATQAILSGKRPRAVDNAIVRNALSDFIRNQLTGE